MLQLSFNDSRLKQDGDKESSESHSSDSDDDGDEKVVVTALFHFTSFPASSSQHEPINSINKNKPFYFT